MSEFVLTKELETEAVTRPGAPTNSWTINSWTSNLTITDALFALVVVMAAVMRLTDLAGIPLSPSEATEALTTWRYWQPNPLEFAGSASPAYFSFTSLLMQLLGDSDIVMRLAPVLFGLGLVILPYFWRHHLGNWGVLVTSTLLALSPVLTMVSRTAGGDAVAVFATLLLLTAWVRFQEERDDSEPVVVAVSDGDNDSGENTDDVTDDVYPVSRSWWFFVGVAAFGLGLTSSPLFFAGLAILLLTWSVHWQLGPRLHDEVARPEPTMLRSAGILLGGVIFVVGTLFFWNPAGLAQTAGHIGEWLQQFSFSGSALDWLAPTLLVGRYESAILLLGFIALAWATWRGETIPTFFVYWFSTSLLIALLQHQTPEITALLILPAYFLIGTWVNRAMQIDEFPPMPLVQWGLFATLLIIGATIYFNVARYARITQTSLDEFANAWLALVCFVFAIAIINFAYSWDRSGTTRAVVMSVLVSILLYQWGTAWWLSHSAANDPRTRWVSFASDDDILTLTDTLSEVSHQLTNSDDELEIVSAVDSPVLRWYLRDYGNLRVGETIPAGAEQTVIITPSNTDPAFGTDYFGADLGLYHIGSLEPEVERPFSDVRWWLFHQNDAVIQIESIIVWVRSDATITR